MGMGVGAQDGGEGMLMVCKGKRSQESMEVRGKYLMDYRQMKLRGVRGVIKMNISWEGKCLWCSVGGRYLCVFVRGKCQGVRSPGTSF